MKSFLINKPKLYSWIGGKSLFRSAQTVPVLLYHVVNDVVPPYLKYVQHVKTIQEFEEDILYLKKYFNLVSVDNVISGPARNGKPIIHLSFDDGLRECYEIIAPILEKHKAPASFYVNPSFVDNKSMSHRYKASFLIDQLPYVNADQTKELAELYELNDNPQEIHHRIKQTYFADGHRIEKAASILGIDFKEVQKKYLPYMTLDQLRDLQTRGFKIGSHGFNHAEFYSMSLDEQLNDLQKCLEWMNRNLKPEKHYFAFPFTDDKVSTEFYSKASSGKEVVFLGTAGLKKDPVLNSFQRIPVEYPGVKLATVLQMEYFYYLVKKIPGKNVVVRA